MINFVSQHLYSQPNHTSSMIQGENYIAWEATKRSASWPQTKRINATNKPKKFIGGKNKISREQ